MFVKYQSWLSQESVFCKHSLSLLIQSKFCSPSSNSKVYLNSSSFLLESKSNSNFGKEFLDILQFEWIPFSEDSEIFTRLWGLESQSKSLFWERSWDRVFTFSSSWVFASFKPMFSFTNSPDLVSSSHILFCSSSISCPFLERFLNAPIEKDV